MRLRERLRALRLPADLQLDVEREALQPAAADIISRLPPINLPLAVPSVLSAEVRSFDLE